MNQEKIRYAAAATDMILEGCNLALQALQVPCRHHAGRCEIGTIGSWTDYDQVPHCLIKAPSAASSLQAPVAQGVITRADLLVLR